MSDLKNAFSKVIQKLADEGVRPAGDDNARMLALMVERALDHAFLAQVPGFNVSRETKMFTDFVSYEVGKASDILGKNDVAAIIDDTVQETMTEVRARGLGSFAPSLRGHAPLVIDKYECNGDWEAAKVGANHKMFAEGFMWKGCLGFGDVSPSFDGCFDTAIMHRILVKIPGFDIAEEMAENDRALMTAFRKFSKTVGLSDVKRILEENAVGMLEKIGAKPTEKIFVGKPLQFKPKTDV